MMFKQSRGERASRKQLKADYSGEEKENMKQQKEKRILNKEGENVWTGFEWAEGDG